MQFGVWIEGQELSAPAKQNSVDSESATRETFIESESTESATFTESESTESATFTESTTTVAPLLECPDFTLISLDDLSQLENHVVAEEFGTFSECCSRINLASCKWNFISLMLRVF